MAAKILVGQETKIQGMYIQMLSLTPNTFGPNHLISQHPECLIYKMRKIEKLTHQNATMCIE